MPRYSAERVVYGGAFGVVYKAINIKTRGVVAIKKVTAGCYNRELRISKLLKHPNIVAFLDYFYSKSQNESLLQQRRGVYYNIVMEYVPSTLYVTIRNQWRTGQSIPFSLIKIYSYQICRALSYCHRKNVCYRALKPQNILLHPDTHIIKLCDFRTARKVKEIEPNSAYNNVSNIRNIKYPAPELLFEQKKTQYITTIDLWSLGCVIAELFLLKPLFQGEKSVDNGSFRCSNIARHHDQLVEIMKILGTPTSQDIMAMNKDYIQTQLILPVVKSLPWKIVFCGVSYENNSVPLAAIDLISKLLIFSPHLRLDAFEALSHPYFDELRALNYKLPSTGNKPHGLFDFTDDEIKYAKKECIAHKIVPMYLYDKFGVISYDKAVILTDGYIRIFWKNKIYPIDIISILMCCFGYGDS
eukprot:473196_1